MKKIYALGIALAISSFAYSQETPLPRGYSQEELEMISRGDIPTTTSSRGIATPPPYPNLRSAAEWEEIHHLLKGQDYSLFDKKISFEKQFDGSGIKNWWD